MLELYPSPCRQLPRLCLVVTSSRSSTQQPCVQRQAVLCCAVHTSMCSMHPDVKQTWPHASLLCSALARLTLHGLCSAESTNCFCHCVCVVLDCHVSACVVCACVACVCFLMVVWRHHHSPPPLLCPRRSRAPLTWPSRTCHGPCAASSCSSRTRRPTSTSCMNASTTTGTLGSAQTFWSCAAAAWCSSSSMTAAWHQAAAGSSAPGQLVL